MGAPFLFEEQGNVYPIYLKLSNRLARGISYKKAYVIFFSIVVAILIGMRSVDVGVDTIRYITSRYGRNSIVLFKDDWEVVADIIAIFAQLITKDPQLFLLLNGILVAGLFGKFIYDNTDRVSIAFVVFIGMFFVQSMNLMREWLAIGFGLNAYTFYRKQQNKKAMLMLVMAILTHLTAIVLLFIPVFDRFRNKKKALFITVVSGLVLVALQYPILRIATTIFPQYIGYYKQDYFLGENAFNIKNLIYIAILLYTIFMSIYTKAKTEKERYWTYAAYMTLAIAFSFCGGTFQMMHRLAYYYSVFLIILIPEVTNKSKFRSIMNLLIVVAMLIMLARNGVSDNNGISNYHFFWE